jgi:serine/threonine protein kinase
MSVVTSSSTSQASRSNQNQEDVTLYKIADAGGANNLSISVVQNKGTKGTLLCKEVQCSFFEATYLLKVGPHPHIVRLYDYTQDDDDDTPEKLYLEFCDLGPLDKVEKGYRASRTPIPEAFIWQVFESVAKALLRMHTGKYSLTEAPTKGWDAVVHGDIQSENIFLSSSGVADQVYPRVVLGDLGEAYYEYTLDDDQLKSGYMTRRKDIRLLGVVIFNLTHAHRMKENDPAEEISNSETIPQRAPHDQLPDPAPEYSRELDVLAKSCMQHDPYERPDAETLLRDIQKAKRP